MRILEQSDFPHYTYNDYVPWDGRWELLDGIVFAMTPAPTVEQQRVSQKIASLLDETLDNCEACVALLPVDWKITEDTIVQSDNLVVCYQPSGSYLTKAPVLIFEVMSPSTRSKDENI
jgi:Uma2 family endonuclease